MDSFLEEVNPAPVRPSTAEIAQDTASLTRELWEQVGHYASQGGKSVVVMDLYAALHRLSQNVERLAYHIQNNNVTEGPF